MSKQAGDATMNIDRLVSEANKLHQKAAAVKHVVLKRGTDFYLIKWNSYLGVFEVTKNGEYLMRYNTRKITQARDWLKEYLTA